MIKVWQETMIKVWHSQFDERWLNRVMKYSHKIGIFSSLCHDFINNCCIFITVFDFFVESIHTIKVLNVTQILSLKLLSIHVFLKVIFTQSSKTDNCKYFNLFEPLNLL